MLKLGAHGALSLHEGAVDEVPADPVRAVGTVGAGDAYLAALVTGQDTKACLDASARMGALVCAAVGRACSYRPA